MKRSSAKSGSTGRPGVYELLEKPMSGAAIEARSMELIDSEAGPHQFSADQWEVVLRMIHTTADFGFVESVRFSAEAIESGVAALRSGATIFADSNMIRSGLSLSRLRQVHSAYGPDDIVCHVADPDIAAKSAECGLPRSLFAVRKAGTRLSGAIAVFGNAPVALMELNRLVMEESVRPALVIAMPVGFVHVVESKEELMSLDVPYIAVAGRRGGSPLAVSAVHALCSLAVRDTNARSKK